MREMRAIESTGADVETAIANGLAKLNLPRRAVAVDVIEPGSRGILGIGARPARVRIVVKETLDDDDEEAYPAHDEPAAEAPPQPAAVAPASEARSAQAPVADPAAEQDARIGAATLEELLSKMQVAAKVHAFRAEPVTDDETPPWVLEIRGRDLGVLIGRKGETLAAMQYLTRLIASRDAQHRVDFIVDVEGYKSRRAKQLRKLAERMAEQAIQRGRTVDLEPMPPYERRIIHMALRGDPRVRTESVGEGERRKVSSRGAEGALPLP